MLGSGESHLYINYDESCTISYFFGDKIVLREITELIDCSYKIPSSFTELGRLPVPLYSSIKWPSRCLPTWECYECHTPQAMLLLLVLMQLLCLNCLRYSCPYWMSVPFAFHNFSNLSKSTESNVILPRCWLSPFPLFLLMCTPNKLNFLLYHLGSRFFFWCLSPSFTHFSPVH